jgi:hypothetical protein
MTIEICHYEDDDEVRWWIRPESWSAYVDHLVKNNIAPREASYWSVSRTTLSDIGTNSEKFRNGVPRLFQIRDGEPVTFIRCAERTK